MQHSLIELEEIVDESGQKVSIEEAKEKEIIPQEYEPVLVARAFGTKARLVDVIEDTPNAKVLFDDARKIVAANFGKESISRTRYFIWLARTIGGSLARMHKGGYVHGNLHAQNITLDGRIMDLDAVKKISSLAEEEQKEGKKEDLDLAEASVMEMVSEIGRIPVLKDIVGQLSLWAIVKKTYYSEMKNKGQ